MNILRLKDVKKVTGLGRTSIYKFIAEGTFPKSVSLSDRAVGWISTEIDEWVLARIRERDSESV